jgi:lysozyme
MNMMKILGREEGFRNVPYLCSEGFVTIGFGTKLHKSKGLDPEDFPIRVSRGMAEEWLHSEVALKDVKLMRSPMGNVHFHLDDDRRAIIISMAYQMGTSGVLRFKNMWSALKAGDYNLAADEMLDSRWAAQTPERAGRHARVMRGERLSNVYPD